MGEEEHPSVVRPPGHTQFWDALAPYHGAVEDTNLDLSSLRRILRHIQDPVLVVGGGHGLLVAELRKNGFQCEGIELSPEMVRYAKLRRGINLVHGDASAMPFADDTYATVIYATGVVDFTADEEAIRTMLNEGRRVVKNPGKILVAFYKGSAAQEEFMVRVGLLDDQVLAFRQSMELYLLNPAQMLAWVAESAGVGTFRAAGLLLRMSAGSTMRELRTTFRMQKILRRMPDPRSLINATPENAPYRNEAGIRALFERLAFPVARFETFASCRVVQVR